MKKLAWVCLALSAVFLAFFATSWIGVSEKMSEQTAEQTAEPVAELAEPYQEEPQTAQEEEARPADIRPEIVPAIEKPVLSQPSHHERGGGLLVENKPDPATPPADGCFKVAFRHKVVAGHPDRSHCEKHRNLISLGTPQEVARVNWKSVCLRVDDVPTAHERAPGGITFGPLAGPDSKVTVTFCRGKAGCAVACPLPHDPFLDAIGASLARGKKAQALIARWDPADSEDDSDPTSALEAELKVDPGTQYGLTVFKEWTALSRTSGCGTTVASKELR